MSNPKLELEKQLIQQQLNEQGLSGYLYGKQVPRVTKCKGARQVEMNAYTLASAILDGIKKRNKDCIQIQLSKEEILEIDLITREILYFNDKTCEESYLDNIKFIEG